MNIQPDKTTKKLAANIQDRSGLKPCHVSSTMLNKVSDCLKGILDNAIETEIDSEQEINNGTEDLFTHVNRLYEEANEKKKRKMKNYILRDFQN